MTLEDATARHLAFLRAEKGASPHTISAYATDFSRFLAFASETYAIEDLERVSRELMISFQQAEATRGVGARTQARRLSSLRGLFRHALEEKWLDQNPLADIRQPRQPRKLPRIRGGLRVSEAISLTLDRLHLPQKALRVVGKGDRERMVPLGQPACQAMERYLEGERSKLLRKGRRDEVFLSPRGSGLTRQAVFALIRRLAARAGLDEAPSPHDLRHAFATHLVEHGADLRAVQTLLGHANISTTEVYTHVSRSHLSRMHEAHHPRERENFGAGRGKKE